MSFPNKAPNALDHVRLKVEITVFYKMYFLGDADFVISYLGLYKLLAPPSNVPAKRYWRLGSRKLCSCSDPLATQD